MLMQDDYGTSADIVRIRLAASQEKLDEAVDLYDKAIQKQRSFNGSVSRAYYSVFKAISAIHMVNGRAYKRHKDAIAKFNEYHVHGGDFPRETGRKLSHAQQRRENSDYDDFYHATQDEAAEQIAFAREFLEQAKSYCRMHGVMID
jgi:uncharacterized protein (UPF0332 family)